MEIKNEQQKKEGLSKVEKDKLTDTLSKELKFNSKEMHRIMKIFQKYVGDSGYMNEHEFSDVLHNSLGYTDDFFMKRIFLAADIHKDNRISIEEFIRILHVMLHGFMQEKIKLCFSCYDLNENLEIKREEVSELLLEAISNPPTKDCNTDALRDLVEMAFTKLDKDGDSIISYEEFQAACLDDWVLMETFGQCLPDHRHRAAFLTLLEADQDIV